MAWQTVNGVMPAAGYFGPISQAKYAMLIAGTVISPGTPPMTGPFCPNGNPISNNCMPVTPVGPLCPNGNPISNNCAPVGTTPPVDTGLTGSSGVVEDYTLISDFTNESVGEDESDVEVIGLEVEAGDNSDLELTAVRVVFDENGTSATSDFEDYASEVSVLLDGEEVARIDGDEFTDDNNWTKTIALDYQTIIQSH